jgi:outer membrane lipoprotein-sorting protein
MTNIMKIVGVFLLSMLLFAQTGNEIIERVDNNRVVASLSYKATLVINIAGKVREKSFEGFAQGEDRAYFEFTAPARDRGTRFLQIGDEMWMYLPAVEKATKIAGHMLRQSLMGSDFSYDDLTENRKLRDVYDVVVLEPDTCRGTQCYVLELTAKVTDVSYYMRKMWVSESTYIPLKTELYAKSGKLMKVVTVLEVRRIDARRYPVHILMENKLRQNTSTELILDGIHIDTAVPSNVFSKAYLERK